MRLPLLELNPDPLRTTLWQRLSEWRRGNRLFRFILDQAARPLRNRDLLIRQGAGAGLQFNASGAKAGYALGIAEPLVQTALSRCLAPGDVFYDLGANVGFLTVIGARLVGPAGHVYAFEPVPELAEAARRNVRRNGFDNVTVLQQGVSSSTSRGELLLCPEPTCAKLSFTGARPDTTTALSIDLVSIDDLLSRAAIRPPSVVKIDVEGAEVDALRGMSATLAHHRPLLLCELHETHAAVMALLEEHGYWRIVLGDPERPVAEAPWNAHVLAGPPEKKAFAVHIASQANDGCRV